MNLVWARAPNSATLRLQVPTHCSLAASARRRTLWMRPSVVFMGFIIHFDALGAPQIHARFAIDDNVMSRERD
jgi:hypothetical protein